MFLGQQLSSRGKIRSFDGCWTCRIRRKKCTENRPVCDECETLQITCHFEKEKPEWMDGNARQREMAEKIKADIKAKRKQLRDGPHTYQGDADTAEACAVDTLATNGQVRTDTSEADNSAYTQVVESRSDLDISNSTPMTKVSWSSPRRAQVKPLGGNDKEMHLLMVYLDYVFPHLFPHYRPPILAGGRRWILSVLESNKSVQHTAISLASFFYAVALNGGDKAHEECTTQMAQELSNQAELGLRALQTELYTITTENVETGPGERLVVLQGIVQMLYFEVATSNNGNWILHLSAAVDIFQQLLASPEDWVKLLNDMYSPKWPPPEYGSRRPWSARQAALRFFTATVIYVDVLSSITLGTAPHLTRYHEDIIPGYQSYERILEPLHVGPLFLDEIFGLPNWILRVMSDVAALEDWKQKQKQAASLSVTHLVSRGLVLSAQIKQGIEILEENSIHQQSVDMPLFMDTDGMQSLHRHQQSDYQLIWLYATLAYLNVVLSGWQPSNPDIYDSVSKATEILSRFPTGPYTRTLAWPLCICGCLCAADDEQRFRQLLQRMNNIHQFGSIQKAAEVVEKNWSMRSAIDENWTIAKCLSVLGFAVLLV